MSNLPLPEYSKEMFFNFTYSDVFKKIYHEGITLVHEAITYLDGAGKSDVSHLNQNDLWSYSVESMDLTTRLMQIASWLILQRSVVEGKVEFEEAYGSKYRLLPDQKKGKENLEKYPVRFLKLIRETDLLLSRIRRLDQNLYQNKHAAKNAVYNQIKSLKSAFSEL